MALTTIQPNGVNEITIPATESIAISNYGGGIASIYYLIENANRPDAWQLQQTLENAGVVLGAFAAGKTVKIEAGRSTVVYDVGASPDTGIGDADTLGGLAPTQFIRSDTDDDVDGILTFTVTPRLDNTIYLVLKTSGGTLRAAIGMTGTNQIEVGHTSHVINILSNGTINAPAADIVLDNNKFLKGKQTGGSAVKMIGMDLSDNVQVGVTGLTLEILSGGTITMPSGEPVTDNNKFFSTRESGGTQRTVIGLDGSNVMQVGNTNNATNIQSNGTLTYNAASLATGTIDTTAAQTITVVDGLITSIA